MTGQITEALYLQGDWTRSSGNSAEVYTNTPAAVQRESQVIKK